MKLNLEDIKLKLESNRYALVNEKYLKDDMESMYDYYKDDSTSRPASIEMHFQEESEFNLKTFSECYLSMIFGREISYYPTEDGIIKLK